MNLRKFLEFDTRGTAAAEFALWLTVLIVPTLSAVDVGIYAYQNMETRTAAQAAAQVVWHECDSTSKLPAIKNCDVGSLLTKMTAAAQSTSLGTNVNISSGYPLEGYYCTQSDGSLASAGTDATFGGTPTGGSTKCTGTNTLPGDFLRVEVTYSFTPVFPGLSIASLLDSNISQTAWVRLD